MTVQQNYKKLQGEVSYEMLLPEDSEKAAGKTTVIHCINKHQRQTNSPRENKFFHDGRTTEMAWTIHLIVRT